MLDRPALDPGAQLVRQLLVRPVHVEEAGIAALGRHLARQQHGEARRPLHEAVVGVPPELAVAGLAPGHAVLDDVRDHAHLRELDAVIEAVRVCASGGSISPKVRPNAT